MFNFQKTMWSDGLIGTDVWEQYGFNEYQLKTGCFGSDGDSNEAGGEFSDPGQGDYTGKDADRNEQDSGLATEGDFAGLVAAHQNTATPMDIGEVRGMMAQIAGAAPSLSPYTGDDDSLQAAGIIGPQGNLTPEQMGFNPTFGYDKTGLTREQLGQSFLEALDDTRDFGSAFASLFGIKSPIGYNKDRGYYEGTSFDPFDSPLIGAALSFISPPLGALYGLTKGVAKGDPLGALTSLVGPFSPVAPAVSLMNKGLSAYNFLGDENKTFSNIAGLNTDPMDTSFFGPALTMDVDPQPSLKDFAGSMMQGTGTTTPAGNMMQSGFTEPEALEGQIGYYGPGMGER